MKREDQGDGRLPRYRLVPRTLCFVFHAGEVLLLRGAPTKRLWANLYNGIGGHVERGEDVATAARREIREETGLEVDHLRLRGVITIDVEPSWGIGLYVFSAEAREQHFVSSPDGELGWFPLTALPASDLVDDLPTLLHKVICAGPTVPPFAAHYHFDSDNRLIAHFSA
jgi:8-oxo-dGTP diphosphatase